MLAFRMAQNMMGPQQDKVELLGVLADDLLVDEPQWILDVWAFKDDGWGPLLDSWVDCKGTRLGRAPFGPLC